MARILQQPKEWQIDCGKCGAIIAYTKVDVEEREYARGDWKLICDCPSCGHNIFVPPESDRTLV